MLTDFLIAFVIQGFDFNFNPFLDNSVTGICLSIISDVLE